MTAPFPDPAVQAAFDAFEPSARRVLLQLRQEVLRIAADSDSIGEIEETLKWGQPSYLTHRPKSGTTLRLGLAKSGAVALFTHCQTTVVSDFQALFPDDFGYDGTRAVHLRRADQAGDPRLAQFIKAALTYHRPA